MSQEGIALAEMIDQLREELMTAMAMGHGQPLRFELGEVTLEAQVTVSREATGKAGLKFLLAETGGGGSTGSSRAQKVVLKLRPVAEDAQKGPSQAPLLLGRKK